MFCSNDSRWAPRRRGCPTSQQVDATVWPHNQTQWLRRWKQVSWSLFAETSVCETWRTSSGLFHQVHLAHHRPHAGQAHLRHPGGKRTCDLRPANQWPSTFTSCHTRCPSDASRALSEFCEEHRWHLLPFPLPWASTSAWRTQDRTTTTHKASGAPHLPQSWWVSLFSALHSTDLSPVRLTHLWTLAGTGSADPKEASPFVIEWIPDVLPRSHMGELRISFEYGHQQSGQLELCEKGSRRMDSNLSKATKTVWVTEHLEDSDGRWGHNIMLIRFCQVIQSAVCHCCCWSVLSHKYSYYWYYQVKRMCENI